MGWFTKYPGTDYSQITLDHIMYTLSELGKTVADLVQRVIRLENQGGGGGGTTDYDDLTDKPQINGVTLQGNKTASQLNLATPADIPTIPVTSVNTKTGAVVLDADDVGAIEAPDLTGATMGWFLRLSPALKWEALPGPVNSVSSVNGQTGAVTLDADDVGAIEAPASPSAGDYLAWDNINQEWIAQALPLYDGS